MICCQNPALIVSLIQQRLHASCQLFIHDRLEHKAQPDAQGEAERLWNLPVKLALLAQ